MDPDGLIYPDKTYHYHTLPFEGANLNPESLAFNKIDPFYPLRFAVDENEAICQFFKEIQKECKTKQCQRAVVVGHNAWFDQQFLNAAAARCNIKHPPFHHFTSFDTATLSALAFGQTVLPKALALAKIEYNPLDAHSALYDAECTAKLFCHIINKWPLSV
jgi:ribonuclease T